MSGAAAPIGYAPPLRPRPMRLSADSLGICEIPLKVPKPGTNFEGAVQGNPNAPEGAVAAAAELQKRRERLQTIEQLAANTAEDAYKEFIDYEHQLELLQQRLDENGRELGQRFRWRDAWRQHTKAEHNDLEFERACTLFNAASAQCFLAARARERGPRHGGLKEALAHFQHAAAFLEKVYEIVKPNIWGLRPKWEGGPASLSPDLSLDVLSALKDLMLAQAQRTVYDKAVSEGLSNGVTAKLAAGAASMFADALKLLQKPEVANHINEEGGLFSKVRCLPSSTHNPPAYDSHPWAQRRRRRLPKARSPLACLCPSAGRQELARPRRVQQAAHARCTPPPPSPTRTHAQPPPALRPGSPACCSAHSPLSSPRPRLARALAP